MQISMDRSEGNDLWRYPTGCSPTAPPAEIFRHEQNYCAPHLLHEERDMSMAGVVGTPLRDAAFQKGEHREIDNFHLHIHCASPLHVEGEYEKIVKAGLEASHLPVRGAESQHSSDSKRLSTDSLRHSFFANAIVNEPQFIPAKRAQGIDFGRKCAKAYYRAVKHVDNHRHLITYTMSPSSVRTFNNVCSLGMSTKRAKHTIIMFDEGPARHLAYTWPLHIHLYQIKCLIQELGSAFEYMRTKVKKKHFTLYLYAIKQRGPQFSSEGVQNWAGLLYWAHHLNDFTDQTTIMNHLSSLGSAKEDFNGSSRGRSLSTEESC
ncbi:hypothetical protein KP509_33G053100 [Ceratopteris richardii]|uniref:DUF7851 domain-containing protein n=1 Tax=Ceratopteris richardii TaxID=49495 RepID=A0A8T2QPP7_CERRI|nr:hypothetical protein KP509_33G053100 [Ceratopteris richardii]